MDQEQQSRWRPTRRQLPWAGAALALMIGAVLIGYRYGITLWDWIKLLIVPAVIAGGGFWFNRQQRQRELDIAREQRDREAEIADRRAQDEALQAYLDQIGNLLLDKARPLRQSKEGDEVRTLARARTLTVLRRLDGERKGRVLQFLYESGLIDKDHTVVDLTSADLAKAHLRAADLSDANLSDTNLNAADLRGARLRETDLYGTYLIAADLREADLAKANLQQANLNRAHLNEANLGQAILLWADLGEAALDNAKLSGATLVEADLRGANLFSAELIEADLRRANLHRADLWGAKLNRAGLSEANLMSATLSWADLSEADLGRSYVLLLAANLSGANLSGIIGVTEEELEQQAYSLEDATMPNGQKYEDWLKDKEGSGEDGENGGPS